MLLTDTEVHTAQISYRGWGQVLVQVCVGCFNWVQSLGLWWVSPWMFFRTPLQSEKCSLFPAPDLPELNLFWFQQNKSNVFKCPFMFNIVLKWADHQHASFDVLVKHHWWRDWADNPTCGGRDQGHMWGQQQHYFYTLRSTVYRICDPSNSTWSSFMTTSWDIR